MGRAGLRRGGPFLAGICAVGLLGPLTPLDGSEGPKRRVVVYPGFGTPEQIIVRGRVIEDPRPLSDPEAGFFDNAVVNVDILRADPLPGAALHVELEGRQLSVQADEHGVFELPWQLAPLPLEPGTYPVAIRLADEPSFRAQAGHGEVHIVDGAEAGIALLSDFDDTVVQSHVTQKARLVLDQLAKNASQLEGVPGAAEAYQRASTAGVSLFFYLSGSPLQLYDRVHRYLGLAGFPDGVILLKNLAERSLFAQGDYKLGRLEQVFATFPQLRFVLIGDSGEHDPEIYATMRERHPDQVAAIVIRKAPGGENHPERFAGMTAIADYAGQTDLLAELVATSR